MKIQKFRDLTFVDINEEQLMVVSCDSSGGIGNKEMDIVKTSPEILGYYTTGVALSEILAVGAEPVTIVNTLSVEMDNTGMQIIEGIKKAISPLNLPDDIVVTGSTEENFPICQTGMGITIIGIINKNQWIRPSTEKGDLCVIVGIPKVGNEVLEDKGRQILSISTLLELVKGCNVQEIIPVGSKGILFEAKEMARTNNLNLVLDKEIFIDLHKSAGPATCAVVSINKDEYEDLRKTCPIPVVKIGEYV